MDILTIILALSILGIAGMIGHKMFEMKTGRGVILTKLHSRTTAYLERRKHFFSQETFATFISLIRHLAMRAFGVVAAEFQRMYSGFHETLKERAVLKTEGASASLFLKNVSEYKEKSAR